MPASWLIAHRGMPGRLQNTRTGVQQALAAGYPAIEVDLVLTKDGVPVLSHDPWLHPEYVDGGGEDKLICRMTWAQVQRHRVDDQAPMDLSELLELLAAHPTVGLYLDVKIERPETHLTAPARAYAAAILGLVQERCPPNPLMIEAPSARVAAAYRRQLTGRYQIFLSWPRYQANKNAVWRTLAWELGEAVGARDAVQAVQDAGADGYTAPMQIVSERERKAAREAGLELVLFGLDESAEVRELRAPGVHLIVDHGPAMARALRRAAGR